MTIETPERLDLHQEGQEATAVTLVAPEAAVHAAEDVLVRLWKAMPLTDQENARSVRDALKVLVILHVSQPGFYEISRLTDSVRGMLEPRISRKADPWWNEVLQLVLSTEEQDGVASAPVPPVVALSPREKTSRAEHRAGMVKRIREANAETLERLADL
jgi:hypothetical protein